MMNGKDICLKFKFFYNRIYYYFFCIVLYYQLNIDPLSFLWKSVFYKKIIKKRYPNFEDSYEKELKRCIVGISSFFTSSFLGAIRIITILSILILIFNLFNIGIMVSFSLSIIITLILDFLSNHFIYDDKLQQLLQLKDTPQQKKKWIIITICVVVGMLLLQAFNFYMCYLISHWKR